MWVNFIMSRLGEFNLTAALDTSDTTCVQLSEPTIEPQAQPRAEKEKKHERNCTKTTTAQKKKKNQEI